MPTTELSSKVRSQILGLAIRGASRDDVLAYLAQDDAATVWPSGLVGDEYDRVTRVLAARDAYRVASKEKAAWMMSVYRRLARQRGPLDVDVVDRLDPATFFERYYFANRPLKIAGFATAWQSFGAWTIDRLEESYGDAIVEIMSGRESRRDYDENVEPLRRKMTFREFVGRLRAAPPEGTNDFYLAARNLVLRRAFGDLVAALAPLPGVLTDHAADTLNLWIGPAGTVTKLHHDLTNVLFLQLTGSKKMWFVPPYDTPNVYVRRGVVAEVDAEHPDYARFPLFRTASVCSLVLNEGDALFIPAGWWHQVRSLSESVSLSFINFVHENLFSLNDQSHFVDPG